MSFWQLFLAIFAAGVLQEVVSFPIHGVLQGRRNDKQMWQMKRWLDDQLEKNRKEHAENMRVIDENHEKKLREHKTEHEAWMQESNSRRDAAEAKHDKFMASLESCEHKSRKLDCKICNKPPMQS